MISKRACLLVLSIFSFAPTFAQINLSEVAFEIGVTKNSELFYKIDKKKEFSFYPKISIGGKLALNIFYWKVFISHWQLEDMWSKDSGNKYSSNILGILFQQLTNNPKNIGKYDIRINYGFSLHFYENESIESQPNPWRSAGKTNSRIWYFDIGLEFNYNISTSFIPKILFEYHQNLRTTKIPYFQPYSFGVGLTYKLY